MSGVTRLAMAKTKGTKAITNEKLRSTGTKK